MSTEQRLRDELSASADHFQPDTEGSLVRVAQTAQRRTRVRRAQLVAIAVVLVIAGSLGLAHTDLQSLRHAPAPAQHSTVPIQPTGGVYDGHSTKAGPLLGEWQTGSYPIQRVRSAMRSAGLGVDDIDRTLGAATRWRTQANVALGMIAFNTWDPTNAVASLRIGDRYSYTANQAHKLVLVSGSSANRLLFSYRITGDRLDLHFRSASPPVDRRTFAEIVAWTAFPFTLVH